MYLAVRGRDLDGALAWVSRALSTNRFQDDLVACWTTQNGGLYVSAYDGKRLYQERLPYDGVKEESVVVLRRADVALVRSVLQDAAGDVQLRQKGRRLRVSSHRAALWVTLTERTPPAALLMTAPPPEYGQAYLVDTAEWRALCRSALRVSKTAWIDADEVYPGLRVPAAYAADALSSITSKKAPMWVYVRGDVCVLKTPRRDVCFAANVKEVADERAANA